ncbi:MAG: GNAT family N-acetyltransferase [Bacteroidetes Order II. Incertae sedis bacterium]|nr:GNAT family N-acetyltransferase [Bacteroidetes Order II. bacterium]
MIPAQTMASSFQLKNGTGVEMISNEEQRQEALTVLETIYCVEKHWVGASTTLFEPSELQDPHKQWLIAYDTHRAVGVVRLSFNRQAHHFPTEYLHFQHADWNAMVMANFLSHNPTAEIGRFAILPEYRSHSRFALMLMQMACTQAILNHCFYILTDVFHGDLQSPFHFHTQILGFEPFATYADERFNSHYPSILLIMDLRKTYLHTKKYQPRIFRTFTQNWPPSLHLQLDTYRYESSPSTFGS